MKPIAYVVTDCNLSNYPGIASKIQAQIDVLKSAGPGVELLAFDPPTSIAGKVVSHLPLTTDSVAWTSIDYKKYSGFYIRRSLFTSRAFISFLRALKRENPNAFVLYEIPTYPYDGEYKTIKRYPMLLKDMIHRGQLHKYVDAVIDLSGSESIFNIKTIQMRNGVDLTKIRARKPANPRTAINVISVSSMMHWHGLDRLISGLAKYYNEEGDDSFRPVVLHLLGDGPELNPLKEQVASAGLEEAVVFYGQCDRKAMDEVYDQCTLAVASLGLHRIGISLASTLKTREYLAKGIPFVYSGEIDVFREEPVDFCMKIDSRDTPVEIRKLVEFHDYLYGRPDEAQVIRRIRSYAEHHVGMDAAMKNVVDYIKEKRHE